MMVCFRWEGEEERVPKRFAERRMILAFSKRASGVYLFVVCALFGLGEGEEGVLVVWKVGGSAGVEERLRVGV